MYMKETTRFPAAAGAEPKARGPAKPALRASRPASATPIPTNRKDLIIGLIKAPTKNFIEDFTRDSIVD
jgi:hypothetical protein